MSVAAEKLRVDRSAVSKFVAKHHDLQIEIEQITHEMNDIAEAQLMVSLRKGEAWAVKYWLDNRGQDRGFGVRKLAFRDEQGTMAVAAVLVGPAKMTPEEWEKSAQAHLNPTTPTIN